MFYQNYDDYMWDIFYFIGLANNSNNMFCMPNMNSQNNLNSYYPSIYKIINPVVQRVISGMNYQYINDDMVNDMTNTIYGIVEGDVNNLENISSNNNLSNDNRRTNQTSAQVNTSSNNINNVNNSVNSVLSTNNSLLRDLIKILVIKELLSRNNIRRFPFNNQMMNVPYYQMPMMNSPYMVN